MAKLRNAEAYDFVTGFVAASRKYKAQYIERWREVIENRDVMPFGENTGDIEEPYAAGQRYRGILRDEGGILLAGGETHAALWTFASKLILTTLGEPRGEYVRATPNGWEDAGPVAETPTRLLRYFFNKPGIFRSMCEIVVETLTIGTGPFEVPWDYRITEMPVRDVAIDPSGFETDVVSRQMVVAHDDPVVRCLDNEDFFPDPGSHLVEDMMGVAKKFTMTAIRARQLAEQGIYNKEAVERAIRQGGEQRRTSHGEDHFRTGLDKPDHADHYDRFQPMPGFEYWGDVPSEETGTTRYVITVWNNEVVRNQRYPLSDPELPFRAAIVNPVQGRFYGISPGEVIRFDQDLQNIISVLLARALIRDVHPPIAYDPELIDDPTMITSAWSPDAPWPITGGPQSVGTVRYQSNIIQAFNHLVLGKARMQETSGALGAIQGQGLGVDRASATEAELTFREALSRPELAAALFEREAWPSLARSVIRRYQQFLTDTPDLQRRVGQLPEPVWIGDVMGDFDVIFQGARLTRSRQGRLQALDRLIGLASAVPQVAMQIPWDRLLPDLVGNTLELGDVAADIATLQTIIRNTTLGQLAGQGGPGRNNVAPSAEPPGTMSAQARGNIGA